MESLDALLADLQSAASLKLSSEKWQAPPASPAPGLGPVKPAIVQRLEANGSGPPDTSLALNSERYASNGSTEFELALTEPGVLEKAPAVTYHSPGTPQHPVGSFPVAGKQPLIIDEFSRTRTNYASDEPMYEPQNIREKGSGAVNMDLQSTGTASVPQIGRGQPAQPSKATMTSLAHNLSELDMLLNDLNSSMLSANLDNAGVATHTHGDYAMPGPRGQPGVPPKPKAGSFVPEAAPSMLAAPKQPAATAAPVYSQVQRKDSLASNTVAAASSATRELDELMNSLSQFKISSSLTEPSAGRQPAPPSAAAESDRAVAAAASSSRAGVGAPGKTTTPPLLPPSSQAAPERSVAVALPAAAATGRQQADLESLLGHLETDLTRQGASVAVRGRCAACSKPIAGQVITALGQVWHPEHFCCRSCGCELGAVSFFERDGVPYCEADYHELFAPKCAACAGPILDKCVTAMDVTWHTECFACAACGRELSNEGFHEKDGRPFCRDDYFAMFAPKCGGCGTPIVENYISALSRHWHPQCFVCMECRAGFAGGSFFDHEGLPYCETHYHARKGSLCAGCQKPVAGRCIAAMGKKFHPEHFACAFCLKQLNKGTFKEQNDKPYCHACFVKLFG